MSQDSSTSNAVPPTPTAIMSKPRSLNTFWCALPNELKLQVMEDVIPKGETISANDFQSTSDSSYNHLLHPLLTSTETHGITKEVMSKQLYADNISNVVFDPNLHVARVLYPSLVMRPLIQHLCIQIPSIDGLTIPFLVMLASVWKSFTNLKKLTLNINNTGTTAFDDPSDPTPSQRWGVVGEAIEALRNTHPQGLSHFPHQSWRLHIRFALNHSTFRACTGVTTRDLLECLTSTSGKEEQLERFRREGGAEWQEFQYKFYTTTYHKTEKMTRKVVRAV
jgi:hypothetical protein